MGQELLEATEELEKKSTKDLQGKLRVRYEKSTILISLSIIYHKIIIYLPSGYLLHSELERSTIL